MFKLAMDKLNTLARAYGDLEDTAYFLGYDDGADSHVNGDFTKDDGHLLEKLVENAERLKVAAQAALDDHKAHSRAGGKYLPQEDKRLMT